MKIDHGGSPKQISNKDLFICPIIVNNDKKSRVVLDYNAASIKRKSKAAQFSQMEKERLISLQSIQMIITFNQYDYHQARKNFHRVSCFLSPFHL